MKLGPDSSTCPVLYDQIISGDTVAFIIIIIICSSYIALFLAEASSKRFAYYYPWQTCYIRHLLNSPGSIHPLTRFKAPRVI